MKPMLICNYNKECESKNFNKDLTVTCNRKDFNNCPYCLNENKLRYYNSGELGVVGTYPAHKDGEYTYLPSLSNGSNSPWIKTCDLYSTREEAEKAKPAEFSY